MREAELPRSVQQEIDAGGLTLHWGDGVPLKAYFEGTDEAFVDLCEVGTLIDLNLDSSQVTSAAFPAVARSTRLENLSLQFTSVRGSALESLRSCKHLQSLVCNPDLELTEAAAAIGSLASLRNLNIEAGMWSNADLKLMCEKLQLKSLNIAQCSHLTDTAAATLLPLAPSLEELFASNTSFGDVACRFICQLTNLKELSLGSTAVTAAGVSQFRSLSQLCRLQLLHCTGLKDANSFVETIAVLARLDSLFIEGCNLPRSAISRLARLRAWKLFA